MATSTLTANGANVDTYFMAHSIHDDYVFQS